MRLRLNEAVRENLDMWSFLPFRGTLSFIVLRITFDFLPKTHHSHGQYSNCSCLKSLLEIPDVKPNYCQGTDVVFFKHAARLL